MTQRGAPITPSSPAPTAPAAPTGPAVADGAAAGTRLSSDALAGITPTGTPTAAPRPRVLASAYWIVDPGVAKQSRDWIYAGPATRRPSRPRASGWIGAAAALAALTCLLLALALAALAGDAVTEMMDVSAAMDVARR